ncbi:MAG: hypothetical protein ACYTFG_16430 [Planctomycetota bacterium]
MTGKTIPAKSLLFGLLLFLSTPILASANESVSVRSLLSEVPWAATPEEGKPVSDGSGGNTLWMAGGGVQFDISLAETNWDATAGFGGLGLGLASLQLLPGKRYPFPAVITADVELIYFPAESSISDIHFTAHGTFGVNLLYKRKGIMLFPYVGIGVGLEIVSGSKRVGTVTVDANDTRLILPWEVGVGFVFDLNENISLFARVGLSFPINPANVYVFMRFQGGILFRL